MWEKAPQIDQELSIYFHIPFCRSRCSYCSFYTRPYRNSVSLSFLEALKKEWSQYQALLEGKRIVSIYFGGGTASLMGAENIATILSWISPPPSAEITLEANPEKTTLLILENFLKAGVNRISFGIQSFDKNLLKWLGRSHSSEEGKEAIFYAAQAGFKNISIDLLYDIPYQTIDSWRDTLDQLSQLPIQHLSLYNLTIDPGTPLFKHKKSFKAHLPSEKKSCQIIREAISSFKKNGLERYEISAFSHPGHRSIHNVGYWIGRDFLGLGPSAFSFWKGCRYRNIADVEKYIDLIQKEGRAVDFQEKLSSTAALHERLAIQLRMVDGIDLQEYPVDPELYKRLENKGWLSIEGSSAKLTDKGIAFYDSVAEEIILLPSEH